MLIDFHAHLFPDAIAPRAVENLVAGSLRQEKRELLPRGEATEKGILSVMKRECVSIALILPIVTRPAQFESILAFAEALNQKYGKRLHAYRRAAIETEKEETTCEKKTLSPFDCLPSAEETARFESLGEPALYSFASVHPDDPSALDRLSLIAERGFRGIKLHPEFQHFNIADRHVIALLQKAESLGLYTVIHAGLDIGFPPPAHGAPEAIAHVLDYIKGDRLIAAHLGGFRMWDDVMRYLVGKPLWLDTAYLGLFDGEPQRSDYLAIIRAHGADKILFGSDYPWKGPREVSALLSSLGLSRAELDKIFHLNAARLLFS